MPLAIPIVSALGQALEMVPRTNLTFLLTERGAPFTAHSLGDWFKKQCRVAELPQCSMHGLRKLAATRLADEGCSEREIMAITGHTSVAEVSRYTKARDQARLAEQAMAVIEARTKLSSVETPLDKTTKTSARSKRDKGDGNPAGICDLGNGVLGQAAKQQCSRANVRFGSKADIEVS
jgi:hypothetical protein